MKKGVMCGLVFLFVVGLVGTFVIGEASAQVRAALTRDMDSPIRGVRYIENLTIQFPNGIFSITENITPTIPAGKKLFIQSVDIHTLLTDNQGVMEARVTIGPGTIARIWVPQTFQAAGTIQRHYTGHRDVNMLLSPGETINIFLFRNDNLGSASTNFAYVCIIGYLVDANP